MTITFNALAQPTRRLSAVSMLLAGSVLLTAGATHAQSAATAGSPTAQADGGAPQAASAAPENEAEIVVTALKRSTRLQDTPLAISAVTGDSLTKSGTTSFTDLNKNAPSLRIVDSGPGQRRVLMRGIQSSGEATVGIYYDESPVSGSVSTSSDAAGTTPDFRLFDVARAEVLRGPQGTLFGSGSMGGTIRIIFEKPKSSEVEGAISGNLSTVKGGKEGGSIDAMINLPIVDDKVAVRFVGYYNKFAGYVDNIRYGQKDINDGREYGGRALLRLTPTERLTLDAAVYYANVDTGSPRSIAETGVKYATSGRAESRNIDENRLYSGTAHYDFDTFQLTAVTSYFDRDRTNDGDVSDTFIGRDTAAGCRTYRTKTRACTDPELTSYLADTRQLFASTLYQPNSVKNWTNEVRLSSSGKSRFNWTVGLFSEDRKTVVRSTLLLASQTTGERLAFTAANIKYDRTIFDNLKQKAAFAELSYELLDGLTATAGTRYYDYKKTVGGRVDVGQEQYSSVVTPFTEARADANGFIYKGNLSWKVNSGLLFYAQAAEGFRPGGVNQVIGLPAALAAYDPDKLRNYEVGMKSTLTRGVYLNIDGYYIDWSNLQVSARTSGTGSVFGLIANAGSARIYGAEAELSATPADNLTFSANLGYTDAKLSEDQISSVVTATGKKGDRLASVPKVTGGIAAQYIYPLSGAKQVMARIDGAYVGTSYSTLSSTDVYRRRDPSYETVNFRTGLQSPDNTWGAYLFVNNVFDKYGIVSIGSSSNTGGLTTVYTVPPRTVGINLLRRFR